MRTSLLTVLAAAALAGCGATEERDRAAAPPPPPATVTGPPEPPPKLAQEGPPPAWVETERGAYGLGFSTYCWKTVCADYIPPRCGDEKLVPTIVVDSGETVRFHLGFEPGDVSMQSSGPGAAQFSPLEKTREPTWRVGTPGVWRLSASAAPGQEGSDASYAACFEQETLTVAEAVARAEGEVVVEGPLWAQGDDVRLCDAVAESYPPQCPSGYLQVRGLDLETVDGLKESSGVRWTEKVVRLTGTLEGDVLHVRG